MGDFNTIFDASHRVNGNAINDMEMRDEAYCIMKFDLRFPKCVRHFFCSNSGVGFGRIRLD